MYLGKYSDLVTNVTRLTWEGYLKAWRCCKGEKNRPCNKCYEVKNKDLHEQGVIKTQISEFMEMVSERGN